MEATQIYIERWMNKEVVIHTYNGIFIGVVQSLGHVRLFGPHGLQPIRLPCPSPSPEACSKSRPLSWWCHPTISLFVVPFSSCLQPFPATGSFPMSWLFAWGGQSTGISASVFPMNVHYWFPLGWTGLITLQSKGFARVFSNTTVQKY